MRLSAPSWLVPGSWLENLRLIAGMKEIDGVEILFFELDDDTMMDFESQLPKIEKLVEARKLSRPIELSLHLPELVTKGAEPRPKADVVLLVEETRQLAGNYVLHPMLSSASPPEVKAWVEAVSALRARFGDRFLLEYTGRESFACAEAALPGLPLCPDTGRLLLDGENPARWIGSRMERVRELHLHAIAEGHDHLPLMGDEAWLRELLPQLESFSGLVEIEVFSLGRFEASRRVLGGLA